MRKGLLAGVALLYFVISMVAQQTNSNPVVPRLIRFSGQTEGPARVIGVTFTLHKGPKDSAVLWTETQNVKLDADGRYSVLLGAKSAEGIPMELFLSGEAQWLGIRVEGQPEQPRVLLVSVPYALKAAEAETLAGHAATEFVTADTLKNAVQQQVRAESTATSRATTPAKGAKGNAVTSPATNFSDNNTSQVIGVTQSGTGAGVFATTTSGYALRGTSATGSAILGTSTGTSGATFGVVGQSASTSGTGVRGNATATTGTNFGVSGTAAAPSGYGVYGVSVATTGAGTGVYGRSASTSGVAVRAVASASSGSTTGLQSTINSPSGIALVLQDSTGIGKLISGLVGPNNSEIFKLDSAGNLATSGFISSNSLFGITSNNESSSSDSDAVFGYAAAGAGAIFRSGANYGVEGFSGGGSLSDLVTTGYSGLSVSGGVFSGPNGVIAVTNTAGGTGGYAVTGIGADSNGVGVTGINQGATGYAIFGVDSANVSGSYAGFFEGKVYASGTFTHGAPAFQVTDHPNDPANKTLTHAAVESSEMKNIYDGVVTTNASGEAEVVLPAYMEAYNHEFRYQLTPIGQFAQAIVLREVQNNRFAIKTDKPHVRVSWQITGVRNDAYAQAHPMEVEAEKPASQRGRYIHPVENGAAKELTIGDEKMRDHMEEARATRKLPPVAHDQRLLPPAIRAVPASKP